MLLSTNMCLNKFYQIKNQRLLLVTYNLPILPDCLYLKLTEVYKQMQAG